MTPEGLVLLLDVSELIAPLTEFAARIVFLLTPTVTFINFEAGLEVDSSTSTPFRIWSAEL